jgi:type II secretion system protein G
VIIYYYIMSSNFERRAFTLVELLVVIAVIGLLTTIAVVALGTARARGRDARRVADLKQVRSALEMYYLDNNAYPTCGQTCDTYCDCTTTGWGGSFTAMEIASNYMGKIPTDPLAGGQTYGYFYARGYRPTGNCTFEGTNNPYTYIIATNLENPTSVSGSCPGGFGAWGRTLNFLSGSGK